MNNIWLTLLIFLAASAYAETSIHRCAQADGTVAFQEMPCAEPGANDDDTHNADENDVPALATNEDNFDFTSPFDESENPPLMAEPEPAPAPLPSQDRSDCEKTTRDAIDEIDLEVRKAPTKEERLAYLAELLDLTRQLRGCKQL